MKEVHGSQWPELQRTDNLQICARGLGVTEMLYVLRMVAVAWCVQVLRFTGLYKPSGTQNN